MGLSKNHFTKIFIGLNTKYNKSGIEVDINLENFGKKLDLAQNALDAQVWNDVRAYMPIDSGNMIQQTNILNQGTRGEVYLYPPDLDYGHYMYEGILYVDPVTGSPFASEGTKKVISDPVKKLTYSNPMAQAHWGEVAIENHKNQWVQVVKNAFE